MYVGTCGECIYGLKCPCRNSLNSAACLTIAKKGKPKHTNADRIRSMTDDELANFMSEVKGDGIYCNEGQEYPIIPEAWKCWLQSEVEE